MMQEQSYKVALIMAIILHALIFWGLLFERSQKAPALALTTQNDIKADIQPPNTMPHEEAIQAVSVDSQEVQDTIDRLKSERLRQKQLEEEQQRNLAKQAQEARNRRIQEQKRLQQLKDETIKLAKKRQQDMKEEQKRLSDLRKQQLQLKQQQEEEARKLSELKKKQAEEEAKARKQQEALAKAREAQKKQAELEQAARNAEKQARISGEVDKYKALIVNAISRQWILPDDVDQSLSSKFRIRLAPNGVVLDVSLIQSSGDPILDRSAQSAIYKASPLPVPSDPDAFNVFRDISLTVRPENVRG